MDKIDKKDKITKELTFCHMCCNNGFKQLIEYIKQYEIDNPTIHLHFTNISYFNAKDGKYPERFDFDLESLREYSYIINENDRSQTIILKNV